MTVQVIHGDCLEVMSALDAGSVQCCVSSPPYYGLRDYGTASWEGGEESCDHRSPTMREGRNEDRPKLAGSDSTNAAQLILAAHSICGKCGAVRIDRQLGLEKTPAEYIEKMVRVFREVRRVLRGDGTLWLNVGDGYAGGGGGEQGRSGEMVGRAVVGARIRSIPRVKGGGLKPKDLIGIPWMLAFALRADGWYLRADIIWHKPNPMPESVTDRPTKSHEYVFLFAKSERYYYDADAIREPLQPSSIARLSQPTLDQQAGSDRVPGKTNGPMKAVPPRRSGNKARKFRVDHGGNPELANSHQGFGVPWEDDGTGRNCRSVWTINTKAYKGAHFATMAPELARRCILAGTAKGDTVLDPFGGAGTTGLVADRLGRNAILIELNPEYAAMARERIDNDAPLFNDAGVA